MAKTDGHAHHRSDSQPDAMSGARHLTDPVCGMTVDPAQAAGTLVHGGRTFAFCSRECLERFQADPERYAGARP